MSEVVVVETQPVETVIEIIGGPTLETTVTQEVQTVVAATPEPVIIDLNSGARGEPGSATLFGDTFPANSQGSIGDTFIVIGNHPATGFVFKKSVLGWEEQGSLRGPAGGINSINGYGGPDVTLNKYDIGLNNVDNTSDATKPISAAMQTALSGKVGTTGNETITGDKNFINGLRASGGFMIRQLNGSDHGYLSFYVRSSSPDERTGFFGYGSAGSTTLLMQNEAPNGSIVLTAPGTGIINANASQLQEKGARVYSANNKPSKADVGLGNVANLLQVDTSTAQTIGGNKTFSNAVSIGNGLLRVGTSTAARLSLISDASGYASWGNPALIGTARTEAENASVYTPGVYLQSSTDTAVNTWPEQYGIILTAFHSAERAFQFTYGKSGNVLPKIRAAEVAGTTNGWQPWLTLADDSKVIHLSGAETVTGQKTFSANPIIPTPSAWNHAAHKQYVDDKVSALVNGAGAALDTLNELSAALGNDPNFATSMATQLAGKEPTINTGAAGLFYRSDKTWAAPTPAQVGLGNVNNVAHVEIAGAQSITGAKTFSADITQGIGTTLKSINDFVSTRTERNLGQAVGDIMITRRHTHFGNTNQFHIVDMVHRGAAGNDWTNTQHYAGIAVDNSFLESPVTGTGGGALRTWILRDPQNARISFGNSTTVYAAFGSSGLVLNVGSFQGNGSNLTALNGSNISSGTVADARLSSNVPLKNTNNVHTQPMSVNTSVGGPLIYAKESGAAYSNANAAIVAEHENPTTTNNWLFQGRASGSNVFTVRGDGLVSSSAGFVGHGGSITGLNASNLASGTAPQARLVPNIHREVFTASNHPRPTGVDFVEWVGPVRPDNAITNDIWVDNSSDVPVAGESIGSPIGAIMIYAGQSNPTGWMEAAGQQLSIATYTALYNALTNSGASFPYGANTNGSGGAGSTHFRLPDLRGKTVFGVDSTADFNALNKQGGAKRVTLSISQIPSHGHTASSGATNTDHLHSGSTGTAFTAAAGQIYAHQAGPSAAANHFVGYGPGGATALGYPADVPGGNHAHNFTTGGVDRTASHSHSVTVNANGGGGDHENLPPYIALKYIIKVS